MQRKFFLIATAVGEAGTGLLLLVVPSLVVALLLGVSSSAPETTFVCRLTGAALLSIGVSSWLARSEAAGAALRGLLIGVLIYDIAAAALLAYAGLVLKFVGIALWPAVVIHVALAVWCLACLRS
jgi:hypothetical protein